MSPTDADISMSCLCCRFFTNDLFLPNPITTEHVTVDPKNESTLTTTSVNNNESVDVSTTPATNTTKTEPTVGINGVVDDTFHINVDPLTAWQRIRLIQPISNEILLVDTHTHAHLERHELSTTTGNDFSNHVYSLINSVSEGRQHESSGDDDDDENYGDGRRMVVMSCAVDMDDWDRCLEYATKSKYRIPALGVHPWYVESVLPVTTSSDGGFTNDETECSATITPTTNTRWLDKLEKLLQLHPGCMVGEIGLCKVARFIRTYNGGKQAALLIQRQIFLQQLLLAAKYRRPVSIHCVNQHGILLDVFNSLHHSDGDDNQIPPAMALHSYTGTVHHVQTLLRWEKQVRASQMSASTDPLLYFGFSHSVNYMMCTSTKAKRQGLETLRSIPRNRILVESDVHCSDHVALGAAGTIAYIAHVRNESIENVAEWTTQNGLRFLSTIAFTATNLP